MIALASAVIDLQTDEGVALVGGRWRHCDARISEVEFTDVAADLGPGGAPNRTYDIEPHAQAADFDDSGWRVLAPEETMLRLGHGKVSFAWYRIAITIPERVGDLDPTGMTAVFECVVDDYAEIWVNGRLPIALGDAGGHVVGGFNVPNRVVLTRDARPGDVYVVAVFGINGPVSAAPSNYIWMRSATLDLLETDDYEQLEVEVTGELPLPGVERVASGFVFTEGPVWTPDGALLFSAPNENVICRWTPGNGVSIFRTKSGYAGLDIGRYSQPGSNGLALDPDGRLTICQHGNRRVVRVNPHGDLTVLADSYGGRRLNSPNDLVYRSDGTLYFTDPPFGLPEQFDDPAKELPFSGVFRVADGRIDVVVDDLAGPNGIAFSPDERFLYVGNWDPRAKVVMRYAVDAAGDLSDPAVLVDLTGEPGEDAIDGIKVDADGRLYVCGPGGVWVIAPDGRRLGLLRLPEDPHNLAWGDGDGRTLYVTALSSVYRVRFP